MEKNNQGARRRGRPPSPPETSRSQRVVTFVTQSEFEQLSELALTEDKPLSTTVYQLLSEYLGKQSNTIK